jgi:histone deacetylase 1/2
MLFFIFTNAQHQPYTRTQGHAACIEYVRRFGKPVMLLGGGGYTPRNVARCWAYETSVVVGQELDNNLPYNDYYEYFSPDYKLHLPTQKNLPNTNGPEYLENTKIAVLKALSMLEHVPSVPISTGQAGTTQIPRAGQDRHARDGEFMDSVDPDVRLTGAMQGQREAAGELMPSGSRDGKDGHGAGGTSSSSRSAEAVKAAVAAWQAAPEGEPEIKGL